MKREEEGREKEKDFSIKKRRFRLIYPGANFQSEVEKRKGWAQLPCNL
jgi:hypothetical protein